MLIDENGTQGKQDAGKRTNATRQPTGENG
jgi:hypothetical protein